MKTTTLKELKEFLITLNDEQLSQPIYILKDDDPIHAIEEAGIQKEDIYCNIADNEDCGSMKDLKEIHGDDFNESEYKLSWLKKGTIFFA